eukprot:5028648-Amphidinium_carterae.1
MTHCLGTTATASMWVLLEVQYKRQLIGPMSEASVAVVGSGTFAPQCSQAMHSMKPTAVVRSANGSSLRIPCSAQLLPCSHRFARGVAPCTDQLD